MDFSDPKVAEGQIAFREAVREGTLTRQMIVELVRERSDVNVSDEDLDQAVDALMATA